MRRLLAFAAMLMVALSSMAIPAAVQAAPRDWTKTVSQTSAGAYVLGNPKAKVRLVEYLSLTCGHCGDFTREAWGPLKANYVSTGRVSLEIRHATRDGFDLAAALLARCTGPAGYFSASQAVLLTQPIWLEQAGAFERQKGDMAGAPLSERLIAFARGTGLADLFEKRGLTSAQIDTCLANKVEQDRLAAMAREAWQERQIGGTPAFLINGQTQSGVFGWATLEPRLKAALHSK